MSFTWIPFYKKCAKELLRFRNDRTSLINWIYNNLQGYINHFKDDSEGSPMPDVDPFTVFAIFNRGITEDKRKDICNKFKEFLGISASIPDDFDGIPVMNTQKSNFIFFAKKRKEGDIERLWQVFEDAVCGNDIAKSYDALSNQGLIKFSITIGLYWICPDKFLPLDSFCQNFLVSLGITFDRTKFLPYDQYKRVMQELSEKIQSGSLGVSNFAEFSYLAYKQKQNVKKQKKGKDNSLTYWTFSPGENASKWELCVQEGIMCIGWTSLGDLTQYASREEMRDEIKKHYPTDGNPKNDSLAVWQFAYEMRPGDIVFAKKGVNKILGRGVVESDYYFDDNYSDFKHIRKVHWTHIGEWETDDKHAYKTLTDITKYDDYVERLNDLIEGNGNLKTVESTDKQFWWLVANPKMWSLSNLNVSEEQEYKLYNDDGHKRRVFQHFLNAKKGDVVIGYESTPTKQVVALLEVSKSNDGKTIRFKKTESLLEPINYTVIRSTPGLENMEYLKNQQGSFFKLTADEYDIIMELIRSENPLQKNVEKVDYDKSNFLDEVFVSDKDYEQLKNLLQRKKNLILQGAPGVGKTFAAKRLAYALMGKKDDDKIMQVQFHQNYCYEDFVMGYKPNEEGGFELKNGIFYRFCKRAAADKGNYYFFIIDEINRGNLSKIFGELLMLIENDYRDKPIQLSYRDEIFAVPDNIYIIGMMNTADRSLAMIDYALRRRFSFFEMKPGFETEGFKKEIQNIGDIHLDNLVKAVIELNKVIESDDSLGSGFCIGHSYLCNLGSEYDLESIVEYDIIPMLKEYWFDNDNKFNHEAQNLRNAIK